MAPLAEKPQLANVNRVRATSTEAEGGQSTVREAHKEMTGKASGFQGLTGGFTHRSVSKEDNASIQPLTLDAKNYEPSMVEWVYDYMQHRYGLKAVADKKFTQVICSTIKYKDRNPRIKLFGRFLELFDNLSAKDFKQYMET